MAAIEVINQSEQTINDSLRKLAALDSVLAELLEPAFARVKTMLNEKREAIAAALKPAREAIAGQLLQ